MEEKKVIAPNISCGHCVATIKRELSEIEGVVKVDADQATKEVTVQWEAPADWATIASTMEEVGYPPRG